MRGIIKLLLHELGFEIKRIECDNKQGYEVEVYTNEKDETYVIEYIDKLSLNTLEESLTFLQRNIYENSSFTKAQKSNLVFVIIYMDNSITNNKYKYIYNIEENSLFCQKFLLWYSEEEIKELNEWLQMEEDILPQLYEIVMKKTNFDSFKKSFTNSKEDEKKIVNLYSLVSRIYIKLPIMTLNSVEVHDKSISDYVSRNIEDINEGLYEMLEKVDFDEENGYLDELLKQVKLEDADYIVINRELRKVGAIVE